MNYVTLNEIYDNGAVMLGNIYKVIDRIKLEISKDIDMVFTDQRELLDELEDLAKSYYNDTNIIVCIEYDRPMGDYSLMYWTSKDVI